MDFEGVIKLREKPDKPLYDAGDGCFCAVYRNADFNEFEAYINALINSGFELLQKNRIGENYFAALVQKCQVNILYSTNDGTIRVSVDEKAPREHFLPQSCVGEAGTTFYCFENDHTLIDCGMCLLLQCPDYSFFVVDSGHYFQMNDNDRLHRFMRERTPMGQKIVINGWLITHSHSDHAAKLLDFLKFNCDDVVIEGFFLNLIRDGYEMEAWGPEERNFNLRLREALENSAVAKHKLHSGERIYIRNFSFDVLCTHEDIYPQKIEDFNDSSAVVMLEAAGSKIFIPGDASEKANQVLLARYKNELKCDVVQISHHGHFGLSRETYEALNADLALFPVTRIKFDEEYPRFEANRRAIELAREYYISSDGTVEVPLPYKSGTVKQHSDETFEDFVKIQHLWGYEYSDEYKKNLYELFLKNGGNLKNFCLPIDYLGSFLD